MTILKLLVCTLLLSQVSCAIPGQAIVGTVLSATSLALSVPHYFVMKSHLRILDFLQMIFLFSALYSTSVYTTFANSLSDSWLKFMPNFYTSICEPTGFACNVGYSLSAGTVLLGIILLALFITGVEKCRKPDKIKFMPVFTLFKGFVRWVYISLVSVSAVYIISYLFGLFTNMLSNFIAPIVVLAICLIFPIAQLIAAKCSQTPETQDTKAKWVQFLAIFRLFALGILVSLQPLSSTLSLVYIGSYIVMVGCGIGYLLLYKFENIPERVLVAVEQAVLVTLFSLYNFKVDVVSDMNIDFYMVCAIFLLEFIYEIYSWVVFIKKSKAEQEVAPADVIRSKTGRVNSYDESMNDINIQLPPPSKKSESSPLVELKSYDALRGSNESPLKNDSQIKRKR